MSLSRTLMVVLDKLIKRSNSVQWNRVTMYPVYNVLFHRSRFGEYKLWSVRIQRTIVITYVFAVPLVVRCNATPLYSKYFKGEVFRRLEL